MSPIVTWHGPRIVARTLAAAKSAIDETTEAAAKAAEDEHWWGARRLRGLESQVINQGARIEGLRVSGRFGTTQRRGFYGLFLELRRPFLRPAADEEFPQLPKRIRERL